MISKLKSISVQEIVVEADAGVALGVAKKEAVMLAAEEMVGVRLLFSGKQYLVKVCDLMDAVKEIYNPQYKAPDILENA